MSRGRIRSGGVASLLALVTTTVTVASAANVNVVEAAAGDTVLVSGAIDFNGWAGYPVPATPTPAEEARYTVYATKVAFDRSGTVFVRDYDTIVRVDPVTGVTQRVAGPATYPGATTVPDGIGEDSLTIGTGWSYNFAVLDDGRMLFDDQDSGETQAPQVFSAPAAGGPVELFTGDGTRGLPTPGAQASATSLDAVNGLYAASGGAAWILGGYDDTFTSQYAHFVAADGTISTHTFPVEPNGGIWPVGASGDVLVTIGSVGIQIGPNLWQYSSSLHALDPSGSVVSTPVTGACGAYSGYYPGNGFASVTSVRYFAVDEGQSPPDLVECTVDRATGMSVAKPIDASLGEWLSGSDDGTVTRGLTSPVEWDPISESWWFVGRSDRLSDNRNSHGLYRHSPELPSVPDGTITVGVATSPAGGAGTVGFAAPFGTTLGHGIQSSPIAVAAGTRLVATTVTPGWAISGVVCDDTDSGADAGPDTVSFMVDPDEDVFCSVTIAETTADVSITKTVDQATVVEGGTLTYTLTATNSGPGVATEVVLFDALPGGVVFAEAGADCVHDGQPSGGGVVCNVNDVAAGESVTRTIRVIAGREGVVANSAMVASASADSDPADNGSATVFVDVVPSEFNPCQTGPSHELWASGENYFGTLGSLIPGSISTPVPVNLLRNVRQVSSGLVATYAVLDDGTVCSWGYSTDFGSLGRPGGVESPGMYGGARPVPRPVRDQFGAPLRASKVIAGFMNVGYAIVDPDGDGAGVLVGWGANATGLVRPGTLGGSFRSAVAVPIPGNRDVRDVSSDGYMTAVIAGDSRVFTWGDDSSGDLGPVPGDQTGSEPIDITDFFPLRPGELPDRVFVMDGHTVVVTDQGRGLCFAAIGPQGGPLCDETIPVVFETTDEIVSIDGAQNVRAISMVLDDDGDGAGDVHSWGPYPGNGELLGTGRGLLRAAVGEPVTQVSFGISHVLALGQSGQVWGWGSPEFGKLGGGGYGSVVLFPVPFGVDNANMIEAGGNSSFVRGDPRSTPTRFESRYVNLARGAIGGTDTELDGATAADRIETSVTNSSSLASGSGELGAVITEGPLDPAIAPNIVGYQALGETVSISTGDVNAASPPPPNDPFLIRFDLYLTPAQRATQTAFGGFVEDLAVLRNNTVVPDCTTPAAPHPEDPCVRTRVFDAATGNALITVATTRFSTWTFAAPIPGVDAGGTYSAIEGTPTPLAGSASGVTAAGTHVEWRSPSGSFDNPGDLATTFTGDDDGVVPVLLIAITAEQTGSDETEIVVTNAPPTIDDVTVPASVAPGGSVSLAATFTDLGRFDTHDVTIDWGDGAGATQLGSTTPGGGSIDATHVYSAAGSFTATITVTDDDGGTVSTTRSIVVTAANAAPTVRADMGVTGLDEIGFQSNIVLINGSFSDPNGPGPLRASVRWSATGSFTPLILNSNGEFVAGYIYGTKGVRTVTVRICGAQGACGFDDITVRTGVTQKITPVRECVLDRGSGTSPRYLARWGYDNPAPFAIAVPSIPMLENTFSTSPFLRGQPQIFHPGQMREVFTTPFNAGTPTWRINGKTAAASRTSTRC